MSVDDASQDRCIDSKEGDRRTLSSVHTDPFVLVLTFVYLETTIMSQPAASLRYVPLMKVTALILSRVGAVNGIPVVQIEVHRAVALTDVVAVHCQLDGAHGNLETVRIVPKQLLEGLRRGVLHERKEEEKRREERGEEITELVRRVPW